MKIDEEFVNEFISITDKHEITPLKIQGVFERVGFKKIITPGGIGNESLHCLFQPIIGLDANCDEMKKIIDEIKEIPKNIAPNTRVYSIMEVNNYLDDINKLILRYS
ncbi:MAG: hypothetical protein KA140_01135 [Caldisericia bacterium]|nr:hypothetical protein [Caldisericia bacterium]